MNILEILTAGQGGAVVGNLAQSFGLDRQQAAAVLEGVVPELSRAMERNSFNRGGISEMVRILGSANYETALEPGAPLSSPGVQDAGIDVLETILGSRDTSRGVAHRVSRQSGVDEGLIKKMLPAIAAAVMGGLASRTGGALDGILGQLGDLAQRPLPVPGAPTARAPTPAPRFETPQPRTADAPPLPRGDTGIAEQRPLPVPGTRPGLGRRDSNPYGDLSDVIRKGGVKLPRGGGTSRSPQMPDVQGGSLDQVIRDLLGGVMGFQSKGVIGWLVRLIVMRWGWGFVKSILRRLLTGR